MSKSVASIRTRRTTLTCPYIMSFLKYVNKCHKFSLLSYFSDPCIANETLTTTVIKFSENYSFTYSTWRMLRLASKSDGSSSKWLRLRSLKETNTFTTAGKTYKKLWLISEVINLYEAKTCCSQTKNDKVLYHITHNFFTFFSKNRRDGNFLSLAVFSVACQLIIY